LRSPTLSVTSNPRVATCDPLLLFGGGASPRLLLVNLSEESRERRSTALLGLGAATPNEAQADRWAGRTPPFVILGREPRRIPVCLLLSAHALGADAEPGVPAGGYSGEPKSEVRSKRAVGISSQRRAGLRGGS